MFDAVLVNLALDGTVFDAIAAFGKLRDVFSIFNVTSSCDEHEFPVTGSFLYFKRYGMIADASKIIPFIIVRPIRKGGACVDTVSFL